MDLKTSNERYVNHQYPLAKNLIQIAMVTPVWKAWLEREQTQSNESKVDCAVS